MSEQAFHWLGGKKGTATLEEMHAVGVPVRDHPSAPTKAGLLLYNATKAAHEQVLAGDWIVKDGDGWARGNSKFVEMMNEVLTLAPQPPVFPGLSALHMERVGYRRPTSAGGYEFRWGGLTVVEMESGGWEPLYVLTAPERATVAESRDDGHND